MRARFITSAADVGGFPDLSLPECAFLGRSNVGKSALLNALAQARIARISKTPGCTQMINFFQVETEKTPFVLADLPGYGYAKAPKHVQRSWQPLAEGYLQQRKDLRMALLLIDLRRGIQEDDLELFHWLETTTRRDTMVRVVATKADKLSKSKIKPAVAKMAADLKIDRAWIMATSATTRQGIDSLRESMLVVARSAT